ncbi:granulin a isoform X2 [Pseudorasbora parva]|uniref:granulin a isoform X2 n=1 Tax=Pseudorasbora parva TaxID=51549 RepID=UPI00351E8A09
MLKLTVGLALVTLVACSQCPNNEFCEAGQSCCQDPTGEISCCPFHHGECCEDHMHCCPEGMLCSVMDCINATHTLPLVKRIPAQQTDLPRSFRMIPSIPVSEDDITCPDGSFCPAEFSCLLMTSSYGCCPVAQGLACSDGKHCCPKYHECSEDSSSCVKQKGQVGTVLCGDGKSECPVDTTCCETEGGQWSCCPMPRAVCCDDQIHCCPEDSVCDVEGSKCLSSTNQELPMWDKFPARLRAEWEDHKPAEIWAEPQVTTTKQITTGGNQMTTLSGTLSESSDVPCNDTASCEDGTTCCKTKDGGWACCPLPEAVCCDDFIHCCPHGTTCNVAAGSCDEPSPSSPWLEKKPVHQNVAVTQDVPCNDTASCEDGTTCCKTKDGGWACCPLPEAVCCEDFIHCCPHGTTCNVAAGTCQEISTSLPWQEKVPVQLISNQNVDVRQDVPCNDTASCLDGTTCCKTKDGGWACCPLPEAVCCEDFIHCCPHGKKCNVAAGTCEDLLCYLVPWVEQVPVKPIISQNVIETQCSDVPCNATASCEDGTTCCKTKDGGWACCPLPEAVCCDDFIHCCPHGTTCNVAAGSCDEPSPSSPWLEKVPTRPRADQKSTENVTCDSCHVCPESNTCCKNFDGDWGCCPLPEAVCCTDGEHCCPAHYSCDVSRLSCIRGDVVIPWYNKIAAQNSPSPNSDIETNQRDEKSICPADSTCCPVTTGEWGCCPLPDAVCCSDQEHCCPKGYRCDLLRRSCTKTTWLYVERVTLVHIGVQRPQLRVSENGIQCGGGYSCQDGQTCCPTSQNSWGCCPYSMAKCCDDMKHCCPVGYKCGEGGICTPAVGFDWNNWVNWRMFFSQKKRAATL